MKKLLSFIFGVIVLMAGTPLQAQRLMPFQRGVELSGSIPLTKNEKLFAKGKYGASLSFSQYLKRYDYAFLTFGYEHQGISYRERTLPLEDMTMQLGYMHPVLSDRGKNVLTYLGVSSLVGYEELNKGKSTLFDGATLLNKSRFVYGGALHLSVECFLLDNFLFVIRGESKIIFGTDLHRFRPALSVGFKFNL